MSSFLSLPDLLEIGQSCGFDAVGAVSAKEFEVLRARLHAYEERGLTGFEWANIDERVDPRGWFPEGRTYISCAMGYLTESGRVTARRHPRHGTHGSVSVYAYGEDYHHVMTRKLGELRHRIERALGRPIQAKFAVDTAPLVDRFIAEQAGIGWIGKNCMFFTPKHGSFVFLGTLLVDIEVEGEHPLQPQRCGGCTQCLQACPTSALLAPGVIQATACLSYITQMKGVIPVEYRKALGKRIWGCDICQWACPENHGVVASSHEEYTPGKEFAYPDLISILRLSGREFKQKFGRTAAAWRGVRTWQRNALIALGNCKDPSSVEIILPYLQHERPEFRVSSAWALKQIGTVEAFNAVKEAVMVESDPTVRHDMMDGLWNELNFEH